MEGAAPGWPDLCASRSPRQAEPRGLCTLLQLTPSQLGSSAPPTTQEALGGTVALCPQRATLTFGLSSATLRLLHTHKHTRARAPQSPSPPARRAHVCCTRSGQWWEKPATRAQRMPAAAEDASPARAQGGDRNFPERTVLFAHCKGAKRIRLPAKTWCRESDPRKQLPGAGAAPTRPRAALRPRAGPDTAPSGGAGLQPDGPGPLGAPRPPSGPRRPAAAYSPRRVERGGAGQFRAQLRSARRTDPRRSAGATAPIR